MVDFKNQNRRETPEERAKRELEEKQKRDSEQQTKDMRGMLEDRRFRDFMWRYINRCGVYRMSWDPSARIHFNEGMRWVGLELLDEVNRASETAEMTMRKEAKEKEAAANGN